MKMQSFEDLTDENIEQKINSGDVLFVEGDNTFLRKIIRFFSGSKFIHSAMLVKIDNSWFVIEARQQNKFNYNIMPVNWWFKRYPNEKTFIGKMPSQHPDNIEIDEQKVLNAALNPDESVRPYKMSLIAAIFILQKRLGLGRSSLNRYFGKKTKPLICSTLIQEAWEKSGVIEEQDYSFPSDIVNMVGGEDALIPFNYEQLIKSPQYTDAPSPSVEAEAENVDSEEFSPTLFNA